jgi:hypothetical protein
LHFVLLLCGRCGGPRRWSFCHVGVIISFNVLQPQLSIYFFT